MNICAITWVVQRGWDHKALIPAFKKIKCWEIWRFIPDHGEFGVYEIIRCWDWFANWVPYLASNNTDIQGWEWDPHIGDGIKKQWLLALILSIMNGVYLEWV